MKERILKLLGREDYVPVTIPNLLRLLGLSPNQRRPLQRSLKELERENRIPPFNGNRNRHIERVDLDSGEVPGRIQITRNGRGFVGTEDPDGSEIAIPSGATGTAFHGDRVLVRRDRQADTGVVIRVLDRHRTEFVGTLERENERFQVIPDDPRLRPAIRVSKARDVGRTARVGDKVLVKLARWENPDIRPEGKIVEVLGSPSGDGVDMLSVMRQYDLPRSFPKEVMRETRQIGTVVPDEDIAGRTDCRGHEVITIDPADAKDFDDAFFLKRSGDNRWRLWVHIADVSHYVKPGTALDDEARRRGNSTYLVDRVIPMLPEALSNELCSLKPNVDRLTKCVEFLISGDGEVLSAKCYPAVIHSRRRLTYEEAMAALGGSPSDGIGRMLHDANRLAARLRKRRFKAGSLELDFPETKIRLDARGRVDRVEQYENDASHQLIEEFMLLANEAVAERLKTLRRPAIHRVHEPPEPRRLREFMNEVRRHNIPCGNLEKTAEVQKLLRRLGEAPVGPVLKIGFLRSLNRARYSVDPLGHYGLAKANYAHFTSPIRRYADLAVHRCLFATSKRNRVALDEVAARISGSERNSSDAERDSKEVKMYAYLQAQVESGKRRRYAALVTDIRDFGFFVDVTDLGLRGLVSNPARKGRRGKDGKSDPAGGRNGRAVRLGDRVDVEVAKVDFSKRQADFHIAPSNAEKRPGAKGGRRRRSQKRRVKPTPGR